MCLAQGPQRSDTGEARTRAPRSRVKHCTIDPLHSLSCRKYVKHASLPIIDQNSHFLTLHAAYTWGTRG